MTRFKSTPNSGLRAVQALGVLVSLCLSTCGLAVAVADEWPPAPPIAPAVDDQSGPLPPSVTAEMVRPGRWRCTFRYPPEGTPKSVTLAGAFNGWNRDALPLKGPDTDGFWSAAVELDAGEHPYKFVVNGDQWKPDPRNPNGADDGHGGKNSVLRLGRLATVQKSPAQPGDGQIDSLALEHRPDSPLYFQPLAADRALVRYRTFAHDVQEILVAVKGEGLTKMTLAREDPRFALYEAQIKLPPRSAGDATTYRATYTFVLSDGPMRVADPNVYTRSFTDATIFKTPDWARNAIWYQIFPDRFRNGNKANDPDPVRPWTSEWFTPSPWEEQNGQTFYKHYVFFRFYGGDLDGLEQELPYLHGLGVNAIYLNPIFKAHSNHKYDATNYLHVDDHFGTKGDYDAVAATEDLLDPSTWKWTESDKRFLAFLKKAHELGFHVIIDGVFNHVGTEHPAFQDVQKNGKKSRYADWFNIKSWDPFEYSGWAGTRDLPEFKKSATGLASESAKQHIFNVTRRWLAPDGDPKAGIDGWRLDVPNEIPAPFWVEWRQLVKSTNPDAYITGEIWDPADQWLDGTHFDAVMNYPFARAVVAWVFDQNWKIKPSEFDRRLQDLRLAYPLPATLVLQNLMDSHDTDRMASMALNPDRAYDNANRIQDNGPNYNNAKPSPECYAKARLAALIQMTYVGAPMVYYGDEVGMWGADDPTDRKPMLWKSLAPYEKPEENFVMEDQLAYYKQIIALRNAHPALRTGSFQTLLTDDVADVWVFLRADENEQLVVAVHASPQELDIDVPLADKAPNVWKAVFGATGEQKAVDHKLHLRVPAEGGVVWHAATPK